MSANPIDEYREHAFSGLSTRQAEAAVLTRAAEKLQYCRDNFEKESRELLRDALRYNQRIWTLFQAALIDEIEPLPPKLREDILNLSVFVDQRTGELQLAPSPEKIDVLITINRHLAAGLKAAGGNVL